jgi:hypothetical protein
MRTNRRAFIAIAILGGPASIILAHQKLTTAWPQAAPSPVDVAAIVQQAYFQCSETPPSGRSSQCDDYIQFFDQCAARKNRCDPRSVYEVFLKLDFSRAQQDDQQPTRPL